MLKRTFKYLSVILFFLRCTAYAQNITSIQYIDKGGFVNLYKLNDSIYRSEQPTDEGFDSLKEWGINSILNLRAEYSDSDYASAPYKKLALYRVPMNSSDMLTAQIVEALQIIRQAKKPLLIHCEKGAHRTGIVTAFYRIIFNGWSVEAAKKEMLYGGYNFNYKHHENIIAYLNPATVKAVMDSLNKLN